MEETEEPQERITLSERKNVENLRELLDGEPLYYLDPSVRIYWSIGVIAAGFVLWILLMVVAGLTTDDIFGIDKGLFPILFFILSVVLMLPYLVWIQLNYNNYTYQFRRKRLVIRKGVLNKERTIIPYTKIQNINVNRNVFQRSLGLSTIKIETAGANPGESEGVIDGIGDYDKFIKHTMDLVEKSRHPQREGPGEEIKDEETELFYLKQILTELIELKKVMEPNDKPAGEPVSREKARKQIRGKIKRGSPK